MAKNSLTRVLEHLRMVAAVHAYRDLADGELLERFVKGSDESAFTVLIERYGASVLGVCRRALGNLHDAEDVCQATFLVLARKAASIRKNTPDDLGKTGVEVEFLGFAERLGPPAKQDLRNRVVCQVDDVFLLGCHRS